MIKRFNFNQLGAYFLRGTFIIAPVFFTIYAIYRILDLIDSPVKELSNSLFGFSFPGLGLFTIIILLIFIGFLGTTFLMDKVFKGLEKLILRIPVVKEIYKAIKDVIGAFASDKKKFEKPVLVEVNEGVHRIGFITNENLSEYDIPETLISVYFPLSYAFTGELLLVKKELITHLDKNDVKDLMKFVISGGIVNTETPK